MKNKLTNSVFTKLLLIFLLIIALVYTTAFYGLNLSIENTKKQYIDNINSQMSLSLDRFEREIKSLESQQHDLLISMDMQRINFAELQYFDYEKAEIINRITDNLVFLSETEYLGYITVDLYNLDRQLGAANGIALYDNMHEEAVSDFILNHKQSNTFSYYDDNIFLVSTNNYSYLKDNIPSTVIRSSISKDYLSEFLLSFSATEGAISAYLFNNDNLIVSTAEENEEILSNLISQNENYSSSDTVKIDNTDYLFYTLYSDELQLRYLQIIPYSEAFSNVIFTQNIIIAIGIVLVLLFVIYVFYTYKTVKKPLAVLIESFNRLEKQDFVQITSSKKDEFTQVFSSFNKMSAKLKTLITDNYQQKILAQKAELRQLQSQINPHFLYNSFFLLKKRIAHNQMQDASDFCDMLGKYFHYITKNYDDYETLDEEIAYAKVYADIQSIRFSKRISVDFSPLPENHKNLIVPKLIIQPIIENAFKYGLESVEFDGLLKVYYTEDTDSNLLHIIVENNGENFDKNESLARHLNETLNDPNWLNAPTGLANIHKRLQLYFEGVCGLDFKDSDDGGLIVTLTISTEYLKRREQNDANDISGRR